MLSKGFKLFLLSSAISLTQILIFQSWCQINDGQMEARENLNCSHEFSSLPPSTSTELPRYTLVGDNERSKRNESLIYLLFFNKLVGVNRHWGMKKETSSPKDLMDVNCPHSNCIFTSKNDLLPHLHDFDVVFINAWWENDLILPKTRHPLQYYVLSINE
jgi:hypothetical protein